MLNGNIKDYLQEEIPIIIINNNQHYYDIKTINDNDYKNLKTETISFKIDTVKFNHQIPKDEYSHPISKKIENDIKYDLDKNTIDKIFQVSNKEIPDKCNSKFKTFIWSLFNYKPNISIYDINFYNYIRSFNNFDYILIHRKLWHSLLHKFNIDESDFLNTFKVYVHDLPDYENNILIGKSVNKENSKIFRFESKQQTFEVINTSFHSISNTKLKFSIHALNDVDKDYVTFRFSYEKYSLGNHILKSLQNYTLIGQLLKNVKIINNRSL